jgi:hypothetical protein
MRRKRDHSASAPGRKQIRILKCATNPTRQNSKTPKLRNLKTQDFRNSQTQKLKNSKTQELRNSGTQELRNSGTRELGNSKNLGSSVFVSSKTPYTNVR